MTQPWLTNQNVCVCVYVYVRVSDPMDTDAVKEQLKECLRQHGIEEEPQFVSETPKLVRVKFSVTQLVAVSGLVDALYERIGHSVSVEMDPMKPPAACVFDVYIRPRHPAAKARSSLGRRNALLLAVLALSAVALVLTKKYFIHNLSDIAMLLR